MKINLPLIESAMQLVLEVRVQQKILSMITLDSTHQVAEISLPEGVRGEEVDIVGRFVGQHGKAVSDEMLLLKSAAASTEPILEPAVEPPTESAAIPAAELEAPAPARRKAKIFKSDEPI